MFELIVLLNSIFIMLLLLWAARNFFGLFRFDFLIVEYLFLYVIFSQIFFAALIFYFSSEDLLPQTKTIIFFMEHLSWEREYVFMSLIATNYAIVSFVLSLVIFSRMKKAPIFSIIHTKEMRQENISLFLALCLVFQVGFLVFFLKEFPLIQLLSGNTGLSATATRVLFSRSGGIKSKLLMQMIDVVFPIVSYISLSDYLMSKSNTKGLLFFSFFILTFFSKLLPLAKGPAAGYVISIICLWSFCSSKKIQPKKLFQIGLLIALTVLFMYQISFDYERISDTFLSIIDRIFLVQYASLPLHFKIFPEFVPFANGLSATIFKWMGFEHIEVSREVMAFMFPRQVAENTLGTANTLFVGDAYGNFGVLGVVFSPIIVAFWIFLSTEFLNKSKNSIDVAFSFYLLWMFVNSFNGGFMAAFVFNVRLLVIIALYISIRLFQSFKVSISQVLLLENLPVDRLKNGPN